MRIEELQALIDDYIENFVERDTIDAIVFKNESYRVCSNIDSATYPVDRSRYYVDVEPVLNEELGECTFESVTAQLVNWLRQICGYVVASCKFEDYIVEQTGWNWTPEHPLPPKSSKGSAICFSRTRGKNDQR